MKRAKKIVFNKESLLIAGLLFKKNLSFLHIHKFEIFKDDFSTENIRN